MFHFKESECALGIAFDLPRAVLRWSWGHLGPTIVWSWGGLGGILGARWVHLAVLLVTREQATKFQLWWLAPGSVLGHFVASFYRV